MSETAPNTATGVLGPQLRRLRAARGLTLDALAELVGLDKGYLSRLERGQKAPSVATLLRLSATFGVPVAELLGETLSDDAVRVTRGSRRRRTAPGIDALASGGALVAFVVRPDVAFAEDAPHEHGGEELLYVLEGAIELAFADRSFMLRAGDVAEFPGHLPHRLRRIGAATAAALVVVARVDRPPPRT